MTKFSIAIVCIAMGTLTGCMGVTSLQPLFPDNAREVVFDPILLGKWQEQDETVYEVTRLSNNGYMVAWEDSGKTEKANFHLVRSGGISLLDVDYAGESGPEHFFLSIRIQPDTITVATAQTTWLQAKIRTSGKLRYRDADGGLVLTASSSELSKELLPYLSQREAFDDETEMKRVK